MSLELRTLPGHLTASIVAWSVRYAALVLIAAVLLTTGALTYTARHLAIDTDTGNMLDPALPHRQAHREYRAAFPHLPGEIVVFTEAAQAGAAEDAANALVSAIRQRTDIARAVSQPGSGEFFETHGLLYLEPAALWKIDERLQAAAPFLGTLAHDPSLRGLFATLNRGLDSSLDAAQEVLLTRMFDRISGALEDLAAGHAAPLRWRDELFDERATPGPKRAFILLDPVLDTRDFQPAAPAIAALRNLIQDFQRQHPAVTVRMTGAAVMDSEELVTVASDAKATTLLSFLCVAGVLIAGLRSATLVGGVLITLACGLLWTAAFATLAVGALNIISVCFAVLFIGMGVDFGIQYTMRYLEETDRGTARAPALVSAARTAGGALALAAIGAAISFLAFVPTAYRGLAQLGIISSGSMVLAWIANLTVLPAILSFLPVPRRRATLATQPTPQTSWIDRHARAILAVTGVVALASACLIPFARFDLNPLNLKDGRTEGVAAFRTLASDPGSSPYTIQVLAPTLAEAARLAREIAKLPEVSKTISLASFVPTEQDEKLEIIEGLRLALAGALEFNAPLVPVSTAEEIASLREFQHRLAAASQNSALSEAFAASLARLQTSLDKATQDPAKIDALVPQLRQQLIGDLELTLRRLNRLLEAEQISLETLPATLREEYVAADGRARIQVIPKADLNDNAAMGAFVRAVQAVAPAATAAPVELYEGSRVVIRACIAASLWALVLTLVLHVVVLHGVLDALLVAAPLVLAMLLTVATSVLCEVPFNFANIIALPLLIGLNNAYGAYLVVRKHSATDVGGLLASSTPRAILFSGLTAIASFGVLGISRHPGMAGMGILISVSLSYAILSALVVLPAMMAVLERPTAKS
jgi:uncharacterized protein